MFQRLNVCFKDKDVIADLRRSLRESEKRNEEINREFQKLLRQKEVLNDRQVFTSCLVTCWEQDIASPAIFMLNRYFMDKYRNSVFLC